MPTKEATRTKTVTVTFSLPAEVEAATVALCGDFNDWAPDGIQLKRNAERRWTADVDLEIGQMYRYRFLLDGERWENDWTALAFEPNADGGDDSVVMV